MIQGGALARQRRLGLRYRRLQHRQLGRQGAARQPVARALHQAAQLGAGAVVLAQLRGLVPQGHAAHHRAGAVAQPGHQARSQHQGAGLVGLEGVENTAGELQIGP